MKKFKNLREGTNKIKVESDYSVCRDGGSHMHKVLSDCEYCQVIQDFGIHSEKEGTRGKWFGMLHPPNHRCDQYVLLDVNDIEFVK